MPTRWTSNDALAKHARRVKAQAGALWPVARKLSLHIARVAARRAPVGQGRFRGALKRSLNGQAVAHNIVTLSSPLPYAGIQDRGGVVRPGTGPLGARLLAMPLNAEAQAILDALGASQSLRSLDLVMIKTRRGRFVLARAADEKRSFKIFRGKVRGEKRQHQFMGLQVLFVLLPKAEIQGHHYVPHLDDPEIAAFAVKEIRAHLRK